MIFSCHIKQKFFYQLLLFILIIGVTVSCSTSKAVNDNANQSSENKQVIAVTVNQSVARDIPAFIQATGSLVADETSNIAPKIAGKVTNVYVNVGEFVPGGKVVARIDDKDARLRLAQAEANVKQAQSAVRQAEARLGLTPKGTFNSSTIPEVRAANANYEQALAELRQAEANENRYRDLVETGDIAMVAYEQYRTNRDTARARVNAAKQNLEATINTARQSNEAINSAQAAVEVARTQVATAQQEIADTVIRAPFSGYISERQVSVGEFVTSSNPVATLMRSNPIKIQIQIPESEVPQVSLGRGVSIQVDAYRDRRFSGVVVGVNPAIDPTSRSAIVEASIENNDNVLRSGMFATAQIGREGGSAGVFVPKSAIYNDQATQSYRIFVIQDKVAKLRVVQLGTEESEFYQILSGIDAGETVATSNLDQLYEGANVSF